MDVVLPNKKEMYMKEKMTVPFYSVRLYTEAYKGVNGTEYFQTRAAAMRYLKKIMDCKYDILIREDAMIPEYNVEVYKMVKVIPGNTEGDRRVQVRQYEVTIRCLQMNS